MDKVTFKYEAKGNKEFYRDIEYSFEYDPDDGLKDLISGFKTFLFGLTYHPNTIDQYVRNVDDEEWELTDEEEENE